MSELATCETQVKKMPSRDAVSDAFHEHARALYRYIFARVHDTALAEDLTSDVFLKALRWVHQERSAASIRGWLYTTARTTIAEYWREQGQQTLMPLEMVEDMPAHPEQREQHCTDARAQMLPLLWRLSTRERDVLILRYLRGYSPAEIGQTLGLSTEHVRQVHLRALRHAARYKGEGRIRIMETPIDLLTDDAHQVLARAEEEALTFKHDYVGTEVVLLSLLHGETIAARTLRNLGVEDYRIRGGINLILGQGK